MDGVERVMVLGIFIVIVLILGVLAWDASSDDPAAVLTSGADGGSGVSAADLSDSQDLNPRGEMAQGPSLTEAVEQRRRRAKLAEQQRAGGGQRAERPGEQVAKAGTGKGPSPNSPAEQLGGNGGLNGNNAAPPSLNSTIRLPSTAPEVLTHVVEEGDTAWRIASKHYGTGDMNAILDMIQDANPGLDLDQLGLGQVIKLPSKAPADAVLPSPEERAAAGEGRTYKVVSGDTLQGISLEQLGDASRWEEIYTLNRHLIASPSGLSIGVTLVLPEN